MSVVLHHGTCFVLGDTRGDLARGEHGFYFEDVRCLARLVLRIDGERAVPLTVTQPRADCCTFWLSNAKSDRLDASVLAILRERRLGEALVDTLTIDSFADEPLDFAVCLELDADFADIYAVKQRALAGHDGVVDTGDTECARDGRRLILSRRLPRARLASELGFDADPGGDGRTARFDVRVARGQPWSLSLEIVSRIEHPDTTRSTRALRRRDDDGRRHDLEHAGCALETDHPVLGRAWARAAADLVALRLSSEETVEGEQAIAAGIPWYMALFGRDSLIASYECVLHDPALARGTLLALAHLQGRREDPASEEQPGRILHEYRKHLRASVRRNVPKFPYYGTIDATPLWLVTLSEYVAASGDVALAAELWPNVARALDWIERWGDRDGDGLVEYQTPPDGFLANEGWKDSPDSVAFADGRLARQPIALVEVQGYVADAYARCARLCEWVGRDAGDGRTPARLRQRAEHTRRLVAERFRLDGGFFAEALDGDKRRVDALTSNPGHLLWSGAVCDDDAAAIARVLLGDELFAGWGVRTMGARQGRYNPVSYHDGSIWPHDNALLLQGLARYGRRAEVTRLAGALVDALGCFADARFPELFSGFGRDEAARPIAYPNANEPQAWASGAVLLLVRALLGLEVDAPARSLTLRPSPLAGASYLRLRHLAVGGARVTVEVRWRGVTPETRVDGLPRGWRVDA